MKRSLALLVALVFGFAAAGLATAQTTAPTPAPAQATPATPAAPTQKPAEMKRAKNAHGTVKTASTDSIVVAGKEKAKEAEWTFAVDPKTAIRKAGKAITAADLKPGDRVAVRYVDQDGKAMAVAIQVRPGAAAAKSEKK